MWLLTHLMMTIVGIASVQWLAVVVFFHWEDIVCMSTPCVNEFSLTFNKLASMSAVSFGLAFIHLDALSYTANGHLASRALY